MSDSRLVVSGRVRITRRTKLAYWLAMVAILVASSDALGCGHEPVSVVLVYEIVDDGSSGNAQQLKEQTVAAINRRLGSDAKARAAEGKRIEVDVYGKLNDEQLRSLEKRVSMTGSLEFAVLANRQDHLVLITKAEKLPADQKDLIEGDRLRAGWRPVGRDRYGNMKKVGEHGQVAVREFERDGKKVREFRVVFEREKYRVTGKYLKQAHKAAGETGDPTIGFLFNTRGGFLFQKLTSANRPRATDQFMRRLAVLLNGEIHSAPNLRETISTSGQISGRFTRADVSELVRVLNAGALPCPIRKVDQRVVPAE